HRGARGTRSGDAAVASSSGIVSTWPGRALLHLISSYQRGKRAPSIDSAPDELVELVPEPLRRDVGEDGLLPLREERREVVLPDLLARELEALLRRLRVPEDELGQASGPVDRDLGARENVDDQVGVGAPRVLGRRARVPRGGRRELPQHRPDDRAV